MKLSKHLASGIAVLLMTASPLLAEGFKFYDFQCEPVGMVRTKDQLIYSGRDPNIGDDITFACKGRSCFARTFWDDGSGNTGVRIRHIYFPRGRVEFIFSYSSWREKKTFHIKTSLMSPRYFLADSPPDDLRGVVLKDSYDIAGTSPLGSKRSSDGSGQALGIAARLDDRSADNGDASKPRNSGRPRSQSERPARSR